MLAFALWTGRVCAAVVLHGDTSTIDEAKLAGLVQLELGAGSDVDEVIVDVTGNTATVTLRRRRDGHQTGTVDLPAVGAGDVERTVALFIGELSREDEESVPAPERPTPITAAPTETSTPRMPDAPPRGGQSSMGIAPSVRVGGTARIFTSGGAVFLGPLLSGQLQIGERLRLGVVGRYALSSTTVMLGTVHAQLASAGPSAAYQLFTHETFAVAAGLGLDLAWMEGSGEGERARSVTGFGVAGSGFVEARWAVARPFILVAALEGGALTPGLDLRVDDRSALAAFGPFAGASIALELDVGRRTTSAGGRDARLARAPKP